MRQTLWGLFFSKLLASVIDNQHETILDNSNPAYMKELAFTHDNTFQTRSGSEDGHISFLDEVGGAINVKSKIDLPKIFFETPPVPLKKPRNIKHGTLKEVHDHLKHSLLSFCPFEEIINYECVCREKYQYVSFHENKTIDSLAVVAVHRTLKTIFVSYRPSMKAKNWITNINYEMTQFPNAPKGAFVHRGFLNYFMTTHNSTRNAVKKLLRNPKLKGYDLIILGTSLGAAISTVAIPFWANLLDKLKDKRKLHGFIYSGPRVGNELFAQYVTGLNIPFTRYTNGNDIVSHLPPRSFGFIHVGAEIHEIHNGLYGKVQLKECRQDYDEDPECGYKDRFHVSIARHAIMLGKLFPLPPYC